MNSDTGQQLAPILDGIRVVELASWTFVPSAGAVLADWGAEVVKIEHPETGDPQRGLISSGMVAGAGSVNHFVEQPNRGKRSVALDVSIPDGLEILYKLVESADVFMTNLLPDSRVRLGVDVGDIQGRNPRIVYARGHGYGSKGGQAGRGGFDLAAYWSRGGIGDAYASDGGAYPPVQRPAFGDLFGGFALAAGVVGALLRRERTGVTSVVDVSLLATAIWQLSPDIVAAKIIGRTPPKVDLEDMPNPATNLYRTADGRFLSLVLLQADRFWADLCARLGRADLVTDERFATTPARFQNRRECIAELRRIFESQPLAHWEERLAGFDGVWDVMRTALEIHDDPQVQANGYLPRVTDGSGNEFALVDSPVQFDEQPNARRRAPEHGEHTEQVLLDSGYDWDKIIALKGNGSIL